MMTILMLIMTLQFSCVNSTETSVKVQGNETSQEIHTIDTPVEIVVREEDEIDSTVEAIEEVEEKRSPIQKVELEENLGQEVIRQEERVEDAPEKDENSAEVQEVAKEVQAGFEEKVVEKELKTQEFEENEVSEEVVVEAEKMEEKVEEVVLAKPNHAAFDALLAAYVSSKGVVNYNGFKSDIGKLDAYLSDLDKNTIAADWSRNEKLAYWINAYNAFTIKLILDNYPVSSIQDIAGGKPWDKKWIKLGGKTYSLNQIENDIIRPEFKEPRIHFAVNCAAQSCPPLGNKAFTAENLNSLLEKQTKSFINNSKYNTINANGAKVSKIFDWYGADFGNKQAFLNKYSSTKIAASAEITYSEYDWALNNK